MGKETSDFPDLPKRVIRAAQRGEPKAFEAILARYERAAFSLAYRMCFDRHLASDIVQEIFLQLYQQLHRFDLDRPFAPWFFRLASNKAINVVKQRRNRKQTVLSELGSEEGPSLADQTPAEDPTAADAASQAEENRRLRTLIANLPAKYSAIVALRYLEDMSVDDIALALDMPVGTVKVRLFRARDVLRQKLKGVE